MKTLSLKLVCLLFLISIFQSCSNEEIKDEHSEQYSEIEFEIDMFNNPNETKSISEDIGSCASEWQLQSLTQKGNLFLNVTIDNKLWSVPIIWTGVKYISDPILLKSGAHQVTEATIISKYGEQTDLLFSAVNEGSEYKKYVPNVLPINFTIGSNNGDVPLFQKSTLDLFVLCVLDETAEDFGFVKWNIHYTKLYCLPFIINYCALGGEDFVAEGSVNIQNGTYDRETNTFIPATGNETPNKWAVINETTEFKAGEALPKLCFVDNYEIDNRYEYYKITFNITYPVEKTIIGYESVYNLSNYSNPKFRTNWDKVNKMLHFDFCECKTWFMPNDCNAPKYESVLIYFNSLQKNYDEILQVQKPNEETWSDGISSLYNKDEISTISGARIEKGTTIRMKVPRACSSSLYMNFNLYGTIHEGEAINSPSMKSLCMLNIHEANFVSYPKERVVLSIPIDNDKDVITSTTCFKPTVSEYAYYEFEFLSTIPSLDVLTLRITGRCVK